MKKYTRLKLVICAIGTILLNGCITTKTPKFGPDLAVKEIVKEGYYNYCHISSSDGFKKKPDYCNTVAIKIDSSGFVSIRHPGNASPGISIVHRLPNDSLVLQSDDSTPKEPNYMYGFVISKNSKAGGFSVIFPSCNFSKAILDDLAGRFGISFDGSGQDNCDLTDIEPQQFGEMMAYLSERPDLTIDFVNTYEYLDSKSGATKYRQEELEKAKKK